ncbi:hypothetical protein NPIL_410931 [Nephila pilipes]|uniref:Uncharacterized protein n=1 Tax=Nephila pilipes TaxID=299642 RepID=A0A8X6IME9_NEPPI|nr:hypothetical protein NPIL_410931 [Nephila pilipes]
MVYGASIRLPEEFLRPCKQIVDPVTFVGRLSESMQRFSLSDHPTSWTKHNLCEKEFEHMQPYFSEDILYQKRFQSSYEGTYKSGHLSEKVFGTLRLGKEFSMSINRLKSAYVHNELVGISGGEKRRPLNRRKSRTQHKKSILQKVLSGKKTRLQSKVQLQYR